MKLNKIKGLFSNKKTFILSFSLFIISLVYHLLNPFEQPTVKELTYKNSSSNSHTKKNINKDNEEIRVFTELFSTKHPQSDKVLHNLFSRSLPLVQEISSEKEIVKLQDPILTNEKTIQETEKEIKTKERESALLSIINELTQIKILGLYKKNNSIALFIKDAGSVAVVRKGYKIKEQYPVEKLTQEYILIKIPEFNEDVKINLKDFNENRYL